MFNIMLQDTLIFSPSEGINWDFLVPGPGGIPIPTYGEYGGPGYTGGERYLPAGSPSPVEAYEVRPIDPLDALFRLHDIAYDPVLTPDPNGRVAGDLALIEGIAAIPDNQLDADASLYGGLATIFAIEQIATQDHSQLPSNTFDYILGAMSDIQNGLQNLHLPGADLL